MIVSNSDCSGKWSWYEKRNNLRLMQTPKTQIKYMNPHSLIRSFYAHGCILQYPLILQVGNEGPDQPTHMPVYTVSTLFSCCSLHKALFQEQMNIAVIASCNASRGNWDPRLVKGDLWTTLAARIQISLPLQAVKSWHSLFVDIQAPTAS